MEIYSSQAFVSIELKTEKDFYPQFILIILVKVLLLENGRPTNNSKIQRN